MFCTCERSLTALSVHLSQTGGQKVQVSTAATDQFGFCQTSRTPLVAALQIVSIPGQLRRSQLKLLESVEK